MINNNCSKFLYVSYLTTITTDLQAAVKNICRKIFLPGSRWKCRDSKGDHGHLSKHVWQMYTQGDSNVG